MNINELHSIVRQGDLSGEEQLFQRLSESFRLFVQQRIWNEQDREEIVQDAILTVSEKYKVTDFTTSFAAWAYRVLENKLLYYYRTKKTRQSRFIRMADERDTIADRTTDPDLKRRLLVCLKKIGTANSRHARVLNFRYLGYETEEICERLKITRNNLYILLSRARSILKLCLEKGDVK